jgi:hypothetical protein
MVTLCIQYALEPSNISDFEAYPKAWPEPVDRCGGKFLGYYLPTKIAGPTNFRMPLIGAKIIRLLPCCA